MRYIHALEALVVPSALNAKLVSDAGLYEFLLLPPWVSHAWLEEDLCGQCDLSSKFARVVATKELVRLSACIGEGGSEVLVRQPREELDRIKEIRLA